MSQLLVPAFVIPPPSAEARERDPCRQVERRAMGMVCSSSQTKNHPQRGSILADDHK